jgi:hypothetical protein
MHPLDTNDRLALIKERAGLGLCNITKCCTEVCPEHIRITDNAIIPLKERVVSAYYDPVMLLLRKLRGKKGEAAVAMGDPQRGPQTPPSTGAPSTEESEASQRGSRGQEAKRSP